MKGLALCHLVAAGEDATNGRAKRSGETRADAGTETAHKPKHRSGRAESAGERQKVARGRVVHTYKVWLEPLRGRGSSEGQRLSLHSWVYRDGSGETDQKAQLGRSNLTRLQGVRNRCQAAGDREVTGKGGDLETD